MEKKIVKKNKNLGTKKTPNPGFFNPDLKVEYVSLKEALFDLSAPGFVAWIKMHMLPEVYRGRTRLYGVFGKSRGVCDVSIREMRLKGYLWVSEPGVGTSFTHFKLTKRALIPRKNLFGLISPAEMIKKAKSA